MVDIGLAGHAPATIVAIGAYDNVVVAVSIHIPGRCHATKVVVCRLPLVVPVGSGILDETRGGAVVDIGLAGHDTAIIVAVGPDDDIIVAIAVDVAGSGYTVAEVVIGGLALVIPVGSGREAGRRAVVDIGLASV